MKSAFGSKRKARKIQVDEEEDTGAPEYGGSTKSLSSRKFSEAIATNPADYEKPANHVVIASSSTTTIPGRKAFKKSSLRQSLVFDDEQDSNDFSAGDTVNKPTIGRSNSTIKKKKPATSRLSFGPGEIISGDAAESLEDDEKFTPKKAIGRRVIESNAFRKSIPYQPPNREEDEERPTYNKDYLNELKSSTPNAPKILTNLHPTAEDEVGLDASELDGAIIVDMDEQPSAAHIPSEAEIREKKERRARLAHEQDFISFNDEGSGRQLSFLPQRKKAESRLVREDEDLGEGFDEFVDDGRISLGKKQEREARRRQRKEMADMIHHAEGSSDEEEDSDAETRAAYEAAQTRAGMDGLHKPSDDAAASAVQMPARITPLPGLTECLERLRTTMSTMEQDMERRHKNMAELEKEKNEILAREVEVQELLKQAGARYAALKSDSNGTMADPQAIAHNGLADRVFADRGLDSFGNTPTIRPDVEEDG
jgi:hypothetical protein